MIISILLCDFTLFEIILSNIFSLLKCLENKNAVDYNLKVHFLYESIVKCALKVKVFYRF